MRIGSCSVCWRLACLKALGLVDGTIVPGEQLSTFLISSHTAQTGKMKALFNAEPRFAGLNITCANVDVLQGREKHFCKTYFVHSCLKIGNDGIRTRGQVRSSDLDEFLNDSGRTNVGTPRSRESLYILAGLEYYLSAK